MLKIVFGIGLLVALAVAAFAFALVWLVKSRYRGKQAPDRPAVEAVLTPTSKIGDCARCGEHRIIVSESDRMCASCYSALRTKALS